MTKLMSSRSLYSAARDSYTRLSNGIFYIRRVRTLFKGNIDLRDLFEWDGAARTRSFPLPRPPVPDALDLRGRMESLHADFCPSLSCIDFYCPAHNSMCNEFHRLKLTRSTYRGLMAETGIANRDEDHRGSLARMREGLRTQMFS